MTLQEGSTPQTPYFSHQFPFPLNSVTISLILMHPSQQRNTTSNPKVSFPLPKSQRNPSLREPNEINTKLKQQAWELLSQMQEWLCWPWLGLFTASIFSPVSISAAGAIFSTSLSQSITELTSLFHLQPSMSLDTHVGLEQSRLRWMPNQLIGIRPGPDYGCADSCIGRFNKGGIQIGLVGISCFLRREGHTWWTKSSRITHFIASVCHNYCRVLLWEHHIKLLSWCMGLAYYAWSGLACQQTSNGCTLKGSRCTCSFLLKT